MSLGGAALQWFHWEHHRRPIKRWEELKGMVLRRFRSDAEGSLHEQWMRVEQRSSVAEYNLEFMEKANPLGEIPENYLMGAYFKGLEEDVRKELRLFEPVNVDHAMSLAEKIDLKNYKPPNVHNTHKNPTPYQRHLSQPRPHATQMSSHIKTPPQSQQIPKTHYPPTTTKILHIKIPSIYLWHQT